MLQEGCQKGVGISGLLFVPSSPWHLHDVRERLVEVWFAPRPFLYHVIPDAVVSSLNVGPIGRLVVLFPWYVIGFLLFLEAGKRCRWPPVVIQQALLGFTNALASFLRQGKPFGQLTLEEQFGSVISGQAVSLFDNQKQCVSRCMCENSTKSHPDRLESAVGKLVALTGADGADGLRF